MKAALLLFGALSLTAGNALAQAVEWPSETPPRPLAARPITFPPYEIKALGNGLKVVLVSHHEQPAVSLRMIVRAGAAMDPKGKLGVAMLTASLLDQGAGTRSAEQIADTIDFAGGILSTGAGTDLTYVSTIVMKDGLDLGLQLMADVVRRPIFDADEIERQRKQALSSLQVAAEDPDSLASRVIDRLIYGFHPYGMPGNGTAESLAGLTRQDIVDFHRQYYAPNNALLAVVGDVSAAEALAGVEKAFGDWERREVPPFAPIDPPPPTRRVIVIDKPDAVQTEIRVGQLGIPRKHDDYAPLDQAVKILGGEGANRLQQVLRSQRGLTYGASADLETYKAAGGIVAETDTRSTATAETLRVAVDEIVRLQRERVSEGELVGAQNYLVGHFPLTVETPDQIATQVLNYLFYELPLDELQNYRERTARVTPDDIQRVARAYFKPDRLAVVLVGNANAFVGDLKAVGFPEVERIPIGQLDLLSADLKQTGRSNLRPPDQAASTVRRDPVGRSRAAYQQTASATPAEDTAADQLLRRVVDARGGLDALRRVKTIVAEADTTIGTLEGKISARTTSYVEYPARMRVEAQLPDARIVQVYADGAAWVHDPSGVHEASPDMSAEFAASTRRDSLALLVGAATGAVQVRSEGEEGHEGRTLKVLAFSGDGVPRVRMFVDPQTALVVKMTYESKMPVQGPAEQRVTEEIFSDYQVVDGVRVPFKAVVKRAGVVLLERQLTSVKVNVPISAEMFAKPQ